MEILCVCVCIHIYVYKIFVYTHMCICTYMYMHVCRLHICMYTCVYIYLYPYTYTKNKLLKWLEFERLTLSSAGEDVEQPERPHPGGGNASWCRPLGNSVAASYKVNSYRSIRCCHLRYPRGMKHDHTETHTNVHSSLLVTVPNQQRPKRPSAGAG